MDVNQLRNFLQLAAKLNFRETSNDSYISQPALSRQIQNLEAEIGAMLFKRTTKQVELTVAGQYFQTEMTRLVSNLDTVIRRTAQIHRGEAGEIKIAHASTAMNTILPRILVEIRENLPDLHTILMESNNIFQIGAIRSREIDIGFGPNINLPDDIESRVVYTENFVVLLPKNHPLSKKTFKSLAQLKDEKFILPTPSVGAGYMDGIINFCKEHGDFVPNIVYESSYSATVLRLVEAGIGISIEPKSSILGQNLNIKYLELTDLPQKVDMKMFWHKERTNEFEAFFKIVDKVMLGL